MSESKKIEWHYLGIEAAAIVVSILLAFWIDAWWDNRTEQAAIRDVLLSLEQEVTENLEYLQGMLVNTHDSLSKTDNALRLLADPALEELPENFYVDIGDAYFYFGPDTTTYAFEAVVDPTIMRAISDPELEAGIRRAFESVEDVERIFQSLRREYNERQAPALAQLFVVSDFQWYDKEPNQLIQLQNDILRQRGILGPTPRPQFTVDEQGIRSRTFWNLLYIWKGHNLEYVTGILVAQDDLQEVLELLQIEIRGDI